MTEKTKKVLFHLHCGNLENRALLETEIDQYLTEVHDWEVHEGELQKKITFDTFVDAMEFVQALGVVAESEGHHPDIMIQYTLVTLTLVSHDLEAITLYDFILAAKIDTLI